MAFNSSKFVTSLYTVVRSWQENVMIQLSKCSWRFAQDILKTGTNLFSLIKFFVKWHLQQSKNACVSEMKRCECC